MSNITVIRTSVDSFLSVAGKVLSPFIVGLFIAFFLNPFVRTMEQKVQIFSERRRRILFSFVALALFTGIIIVIIAFILPEIIDSVNSVIATLPQSIETIQKSFEEFLQKSSAEYGFVTDETFRKVIAPMFPDSSNITQIATTVLSKTLSFGKGIFNFILGLIIAFYMLIYKDGFKKYWVKMIYVFFDPHRAQRIIDNFSRANKIFEGFFVGKTIDSAIIGVLCFTIMSLFIRPKYILLSSVIVGVTNMIPFFGPFIGGIPVVILNLFYDLKMGLIVAIFILLLQQFDGYILGPKILGDSTGLSPFWVITSILLASAMFGVLGMFLGVPIFAVLRLFFDEYVERSYKEKYGGKRNGSA